MKRILRPTIGIAATLLLASTLTACSNSADNGTESAGGGDGGQVIFLSSQPAGDSGSIDDMVAGLATVGEQEDIETKFLEVTDPSAFESSLRNAAQSGANVVVTAFPDMSDALAQVAPDFPDTQFVQIFADEPATSVSNLTTIGFQINQAMYVAGYSAANLSESGTIGWVGGDSSPTLSANFHAYEAGALAAKPEITVLSGVVGSFSDPATGRDIALGMISKGADVVQTDASGSSLGVVEAAQQRSALVFADSSGEVAAEYPETVVGTTYLKFGAALISSVENALADGYQAGHVQVGLDGGIVGLNFAESFINGSNPRVADIPAVEEKAVELQKEIISGDLVVIFDPSGI